MAKFVCSVCGYVHEDLTAPENCPVCMAPASDFTEKEELQPHSQMTNAKVKEYVCPNCGATTTNAENCEHCGSLLVRFVAKGIDINNTPYTDDSLVFPELIAELENNLRYQAENKDNVFTEIHWINRYGKEKYLWVDNDSVTLSENDNSPQTIHLEFEVSFDYTSDVNSPNYNIETEGEIKNFSQLMSFPLFSVEELDGEEWYSRYYTINCGSDAKGAACLLSEILTKVFGISSSDSFEVFTTYDDISEEYFAWKKEHGYNDGYLSRDDDDEDSLDSSDATNLNANNQNDADEEEIVNLYKKTGAALQVVKWYKETYDVDLKEAKDRVDFVLDKHGLRSLTKGSGCMVTILIAIISTLSAFFLL